MTTQHGPCGYSLHSMDLEDCPACGRPIGPKGPGGIQVMHDATRPTTAFVPVCRRCVVRLKRGSAAEQDEYGRRLDAFLRRTVPLLRRVDDLPMPGRG
jgi:hypothetical protein